MQVPKRGEVMTPGEWVAVIASLISLFAVFVTLNRNKQDITYRDTKEDVQLESRMTALEKQLERMVPVNDRVVRLETQIGVFWHMVEQMSVAQLVHTTDKDRQDAQIYDKMKANAPTDVLIRLGEYLAARLKHPDTPYDEKALIILKLGALQAQLIDRGEDPIPI